MNGWLLISTVYCLVKTVIEVRENLLSQCPDECMSLPGGVDGPLARGRGILCLAQPRRCEPKGLYPYRDRQPRHNTNNQPDICLSFEI